MIVVEHNSDLIKCADHIVDLGPEGGKKGGLLLAEGTPEEIIAHKSSHTSRFLNKEFETQLTQNLI